MYNMVSKVFLRNILVIVLLLNIINRKICEAGLRIIGGRDALKDEFPFAVRLDYQMMTNVNGTEQFLYIPVCSGAAITPSWILTAAHCGSESLNKLHNLHIESVPKLFARYNSYFPQELGNFSPITKMIAHTSYLKSMKYDIALYQTEKLKVSSYAKISAIDYSAFVGHEVITIGFGMNDASPGEKPVQVLKGILVKCDVRVDHLFENNVLCVVPRCGSEAMLCPGDSGGPVVHASGVVGVNTASFSKCTKILHPGHPSSVISMISPLVDWISNIIAKETDQTVN